MMICPQCKKEFSDDNKFCAECGSRLVAQPPAEDNAPSASIGDKNVIAGDVVHGSLDNSKYYGNVSNTSTTNTVNNTVINQDETKKVVSCHVCGKNIPFTEAICCPKCGQMTCENCYDSSARMCRTCIANQKAENEEAYRRKLFQVLEDGIISVQERRELVQLQTRLGIGDERAAELERQCKAERTAGKASADKPLTMYEERLLDAAEASLWEPDGRDAAWEQINTVYQQHPFNERVISLRVQCARMVLPPDQFRTYLGEIRADIPAVYLAAVDLALQEGDFIEAERKLVAAERLWPQDFLVACRRALYSLAVADDFHDGSLVQEAVKIMQKVPEPAGKLERSWQVKTMNSIAIASNDTPAPVTEESCRSQDLYYGIASDAFIGKNKQAEMEQAKQKAAKAAAEKAATEEAARKAAEKAAAEKAAKEATERAAAEKAAADEAARKAVAEEAARKAAEKAVDDEAFLRQGGMILTLGNGVELKLVKIAAGSFMMGSPASEEGRNDDEKQHKVTLTKDFWLGRYPVTQGQWKAVMGTTVLDQANRKHPEEGEKKIGNQGDDYPMYYVSWEEAMEFCRMLTERERSAGRLLDGYEYTLPTEAQWEYACRAGTETALYNGGIRILGERNAPALDKIAWYGGNSSVGYEGTGWKTEKWKEKQYPGGLAGSRLVGKKTPNAWGLYDMLGNVWEWCRDWYAEYPGRSFFFFQGNATDPTGPSSGSERVLRGGGWGSSARYCRSADRNSHEPSFSRSHLGFRLALARVQ